MSNTAPAGYLSTPDRSRMGGACAEADPKACSLRPYDEGCPDGKTPHHVMPSHCFVKDGLRALNQRGPGIYGGKKPLKMAGGKVATLGTEISQADIDASCVSGWEKYRGKKAPCVCVTGESWNTKDAQGQLLEHGQIHAGVDVAEAKACMQAGGGYGNETAWDFDEAKKACAASVAKVTGCPAACIEAQLEEFHKTVAGIDPAKKDAKPPPVRAKVQNRKIEEEAKKQVNEGSAIRPPKKRAL